ncbi:MAG TPA: hypothetical protein VEA69_05590 [Tepidisphaeraceae bacterium]|nr:hypothetical protein [Tepidisphaeraceae bacterium]
MSTGQTPQNNPDRPDDSAKRHPDMKGGDGPGTGAKAVGGVNTASGAGSPDQPSGGTTGVETEKVAHPGEGVASGGSLKAALDDAGVTPAGGGGGQQPAQSDTPNPT